VVVWKPLGYGKKVGMVDRKLAWEKNITDIYGKKTITDSSVIKFSFPLSCVDMR
jgi:hypothetical protein